ncbi:MAG: LapA family protein [Burkholderiaceae bacterium]|nr:LapA family protein [Burkholderiaceae bacterium]
MRLLLWVVIGVIAFFGFMNWPVLNAPAPLWVGVTTITAPLGTLMLVLFGIIVLLMLIEQSAALGETRRYGRDLDAQRKLADQAEASRFTELRTYLAQEMSSLRTALDQQGNALAATIAELDDRLERGNSVLRPPPPLR